MKHISLRLLFLCGLMTTSVCAFGQLSFSGTNPPEEGWKNEGVQWSVVDDEGSKAIEFRNESDLDFIGFSTQLDRGFAESLSESGFVLNCKIKILPVNEGVGFSFSLNAPRLTGVNITFHRRPGTTGGLVSIGSYDAEADKNVNSNIKDGLDRYMDLQAKVVPDSNGAKVTVSVDGSELYSFGIPLTDSQRRDFNIISGNKGNTDAKVVILIKDFELKAL